MPTFFIEQFGCRATQADGAAIERQLLDRGCTSAATPTTADIVVLNTCTVTASADAQARDAIRRLHAANPAVRLIVTGCYAQRAPEELAALPGVSWVVGNSHKPQIPLLIDSLSSVTPPNSANDFFPVAALHSDSTVPFHSFVGAELAPPNSPHLAKILTGNIFDRAEFLSAPVLGGEGNHTRPTLKIQDGCDSRCSYCVIPFVRGKSRSLPSDRVIEEIRRLTVGQALLPVRSESLRAPLQAREIVLSGINLGTYGRDLSPRVEFEDLLRRILGETSVERLRISSIEPLDVTQDLVDLFASTDRIAQHFHMPLQSASNRILAAMHRWYRAEHYARRIELVHERLPHAAIGADVITGFPGETEDDHAVTLAFIESLPFTYLHVFSFSKRPGTKAAALSNEVPGAIIKRRARELRALGEKKSAAFRQSQISRTLRVLTLHPSNELPDRQTSSLSSNYLRVFVGGVFPANQWLDVRLNSCQGTCLVGRVSESVFLPM
ncbi:MAG: tRNA (N(6)-L-threonylcarbamoyladenosine(37)-C(2))-methylthiotransferase MtaB [Acidobacteria bacterium 13_2_20CM_57_17]|nr:MAG: tRNA (N(6)-L-threonylcarbamoyladenosine(37)-C(2))-methylthiotransferase MtaB [Acidobacteria bacterium 13_2_20CM_57_17]OLE16342.1 MAG: tRNA (N(6)-L-threonylcarbamoyladenosine(37)-C(2))-methylthiotransferase MtaB [Acidobacteria bacterium 13_1_20CM_4_57_11]